MTGLQQRAGVAGNRTVERYIELEGTRVRYLEAGLQHSGPPLVMLHGFQAGADYWFPHPFPVFSREHYVIAPDLPGFGYSGKLTKHCLEGYSDFLPSFLDALRLERANLFGHSMGGQIAIASAAQHPERVNKLVLVGSAGMPQPGHEWQVPFRMLTDASTRHFGLYPTMIKLAVRTAATGECLQMLRRQHVADYLRSITAPTLIVWGSRDRVVPLEHGAFMKKHIPNARLAIVRGAGHMPFYQKPEEFNRIVLGFLRAG